MILERDKERGGGVVVTTPTTNDAVAVENRPAKTPITYAKVNNFAQ